MKNKNDLDFSYLSPENTKFRQKYLTKRLYKHLSEKNYLEAFFIGSSFVESNLKFTLEALLILENIMFLKHSGTKLQKEDSNIQTNTMGFNLKKLKQYKLNFLSKKEIKEFFDKFEDYIKIRNEIIHHLYAHTSESLIKRKARKALELGSILFKTMDKINKFTSSLGRKINKGILQKAKRKRTIQELTN